MTSIARVAKAFVGYIPSHADAVRYFYKYSGLQFLWRAIFRPTSTAASSKIPSKAGRRKHSSRSKAKSSKRVTKSVSSSDIELPILHRHHSAETSSVTSSDGRIYDDAAMAAEEADCSGGEDTSSGEEYAYL
jgi:hypothetical protein